MAAFLVVFGIAFLFLGLVLVYEAYKYRNHEFSTRIMDLRTALWMCVVGLVMLSWGLRI